MKRSIGGGLACLLVVSLMGWHRVAAAAGSDQSGAQVAGEGRSLNLFFFYPGGELAVRPLEVVLRMEGASLAGERKVVVKEGRHTLFIPSGREPLVRLKVEGDGKRHADTVLILSARQDLAAYPVFLYPAGDNPFSRYRPGAASYDEGVAAAVRTRLERAVLSAESGKIGAAITEITTALVAAPRFTGALNQLGLTFYRHGRMVEAAAAFTQAVTLGDRSPHAYLNLGVTLNRLGRYLESITLLTGLLESNPAMVRIRLPLAEALVQIQQWDAAVEMLQPALTQIDTLPPDLQAEAHYILARTMYREERYRAAIRELTRALAGNVAWANTANAWMLLGSSHLELKQPVEAEKSLLRALELGGNTVIQARYRLGLLYFREKRFEESARQLEIFLRDGRNEADSLIIRDAQVMLGNIRSGMEKR